MADESGKRPILSPVFLLRRPRGLDVPAVQRAAERAFGVPFDGRERAVLTAPDRPGQFLVRRPEGALLVLDVPRPYVKDVGAAAAEIHEFRAKVAMQEHGAWMSVDWFGSPPAGGAAEAYRHIGKLAAQLVTEDCPAVYSTTERRINSFGPDTLPLLRGPDPLAVLTARREVPFVQVRKEDPKLAAAVAEARRRWPEFVDAFADRKPDQSFAVKVPFREGEAGDAEFMWVQVSAVEPNAVRGHLVSEPRWVKHLKLYDPVTVPLGELNDWLYSDGPRMVGGFTAKVLEEQGE